MELTKDQMNMARWIADLMRADGMTAAQLEALGIDAVTAYMEEVGRRIERIQTTYLTRVDARDAMQSAVVHSFHDGQR